MGDLKNKKLAIIGLGYVGIPLAVEFVKKGFDVTGFDINTAKIENLKNGIDATGEVDTNDIEALKRIRFTDQQSDLNPVDIYIVTVPTPIDQSKQPDLRPILSASRLIGECLSKDNIVIYESTNLRFIPGARKRIVYRYWRNTVGWSSTKISFVAILRNVLIREIRKDAFSIL